MLNTALMVPGTMPVGNVVIIGLGIVFSGLICIVILCSLMGKIIGLLQKKEVSAPVAAPVAAEIPNRAELVAAISCCVAEELGTDVSAIRILSMKKLS